MPARLPMSRNIVAKVKGTLYGRRNLNILAACRRPDRERGYLSSDLAIPVKFLQK
jgi:hypothetical protein